MLEEANGNEAKVPDIMRRAFKKLAKAGIIVSRQSWLNEAVQAEKVKSYEVSKAIIHESILIGTEQFEELDDKQKGKELRALYLRDSD